MSNENTDPDSENTGDNESSMFDGIDLGPTYMYHANISTPDEMNMSEAGDLNTLATNVVGLINYGALLTTGDTIANRKIKNEEATLGPDQRLGDRFFLETPNKCLPVNIEGLHIDPETNEVLSDQSNNDIRTPVKRFVYIDHIPNGYVPGLGNMSTFRGLVPGMLGNILDLNPLKIVQSFTAPAMRKCMKVKAQTILYNDTDKKHDVSEREEYVAVSDIETLNPCSFKNIYVADTGPYNDKNPLPWPNGKTDSCGEGFKNMFKMKNKSIRKSVINYKNKPLAKMFNLSFGVLLAYLLFKILKKEIK